MNIRPGIIPDVTRALRTLLEWIYPNGCAICGRECPAALPLCSICHRLLPYFSNPLCLVCGEFITPTASHDECRLHSHGGLTWLWFAGMFDDGYRPLIHALKYEHQRAIGAFFGRKIGRSILREHAREMSNFLLVPVPLHPTRRKQRGYNQSDTIASGLARATGMTMADDILVRIRKTKDQTKLSPRERVANVRGAFAVKNPALISGRTVVLVDDVLTTGATLQECARVLYTAEPVDVRAAVIALARPPGAR